jgi:hypothetical protein
MSMKTWLLVTSCIAVAPLWLAGGVISCDTCYQAIPLMLDHEIAWQELDVSAGERHVLRVFEMEGEAKAALVMFDEEARVHDVHCEQSSGETYCEFVADADGQVGVAVEPLTSRAEVVIELEVAH